MYSNCLFEAIKAKIKDPKNVQIHLIPPSINNWNLHFYWSNKSNQSIYHYSEENKNCLSRFKILFHGKLKSRWILSFEELLYKKCSLKDGQKRNKSKLQKN